jgi:hypothetical protein
MTNQTRGRFDDGPSGDAAAAHAATPSGPHPVLWYRDCFASRVKGGRNDTMAPIDNPQILSAQPASGAARPNS